ncbi:hypothetical protein [Caldicellulosiruptor bescii]|nr:hypothetical protein [Caldicellulosiruptor bescii]
MMNYLALLYSELHKVEVKSVIGCVTMETKERLEKQLELITNGEKFYYCFGREELREIRDANFWNNIA